MMSDKAPFVVSLILAVLGWLVSHMVDRITESPTLEYFAEEHVAGNHRRLNVELTNITRGQSFQGITATIAYPRAVVADAHMDAVQPAYDGGTQPERSGATATFQFAPIMPGGQINFSAEAIASSEPELRIFSDASRPLRLQKRGLETFFVRNEVAAFAVLIVLWLLALAFMGAWRVSVRRRSRSSDPSSADPLAKDTTSKLSRRSGK